MSTQDIVERIAIARVEGRLENVLERQKQLAALHQSLHQRFDDVVRALQQDLGCPAELAMVELTTALDAINTLYKRLDFEDVLAKERNVKNGANTALFSVPLGTTLVMQLSSSPIVSTLGPLAAALAAGNPTIVLGSPTLPTTGVLLERTILEALDREAFHFENSADASTCKAFAQAEYAVVVLHSLEISHAIGPLVHTANPSVRLLEPYYGIPAGIIDRSVAGSINVAVKQILQRVPKGSNGNPLRVPRLFFVDESVIASVKDKMQARHEETSNDVDEWLRKHYSGLSPRYSTIRDKTQQMVEFPTVGSATILKLSDDSEIILIPTTSLDNTIDLLNKINAGTGAQAIYVFAGGKEAFYLGNFITTSHVYINDIPAQSLGML
ncbi:hypothetical protein N0V94_004144 [Neodidymelliopsis sp. IMI 364377]|nr:hypothetical protein N0V94_004144 [Neodidymelliopsis sp. IMI 364377]